MNQQGEKMHQLSMEEMRNKWILKDFEITLKLLKQIHMIQRV
ncbi:MAG: hypothetical protein Ta2E_02010 [Mycoplasmoidaceae bacterium]|nr:MAG: hypothetical protein Ta2E_02010 [Mycoplasmoidaceae bacterium]